MDGVSVKWGTPHPTAHTHSVSLDSPLLMHLMTHCSASPYPETAGCQNCIQGIRDFLDLRGAQWV